MSFEDEVARYVPCPVRRKDLRRWAAAVVRRRAHEVLLSPAAQEASIQADIQQICWEARWSASPAASDLNVARQQARLLLYEARVARGEYAPRPGALRSRAWRARQKARRAAP